MKKHVCAIISVALALTLCGCTVSEKLPEESSSVESSSIDQSSMLMSSSEEEKSSVPEKVYLDAADYLPSTADYVKSVIKEHVSKIEKPDMSDYEKVKAAADYVMSIGSYTVSPALDVWRFRSADDSIPTYMEMRALNMLLFGAETCEGYAAALNLLLNEMGVETRYITGLVYVTRDGVRGLGYHSWSQVKIDDVWYHLDCDVEDVVSRTGWVNYRYFLKSDAVMRNTHYWGQRLIDLGQLAEEQVEEIREKYMGEVCPRNYPTPAANYIEVNEDPDIREIRRELSRELADYEDKYGKLEYIKLDIIPPVFISYFTGVEDPETEREIMMKHFAVTYQDRRSLIQDPDSPEGPENFEIPWADGKIWGV